MPRCAVAARRRVLGERLCELGLDADDRSRSPEHHVKVRGPATEVDLLATLDLQRSDETAQAGDAELVLGPHPAPEGVHRQRGRGVGGVGGALAGLGGLELAACAESELIV